MRYQRKCLQTLHHCIMRTVHTLTAIGLAGATTCFVIAMSCSVRAATGLIVDEPTIFLFPEHFTGSVFVFYDVPDAPPPKFEDGTRVLDVPKDGWVTTQLKRGHNPATQFYFVDKNGQRTPIRWEKSVRDRDTAPDAKEVLIRGGTRGSEGTSVENCVVDVLGFFVGTVDDLNKNLETIHDPKKRELARTREEREHLSAQEEGEAIDNFIIQHPPRCARPTPVPTATPTP
jgi:hypothetical protein